MKHLVEGHGGSIGVDSAGQGLGATFTVRLPLARAAQYLGRAGHAGPARESEPESLAGLR